MRSSALILLAALMLSGCATGGLSRISGDLSNPSEQASGETIGGIVGGGLIMGDLGANLSRRARLAGVDAEYVALEKTPPGQPVAWSDERSGSSGRVVAAPPYRVGSQDCRSYEHAVNAEGATRAARGTACRNEDGSWTLLN